MRKVLIIILGFVVLVAMSFFLWLHYRYLWHQRSGQFYQDDSTQFTFYYPKGFNLFRLEDLKRRNQDFLAGFKKAERDSIACGVIAKEKPASYEWNPQKELLDTLLVLKRNQNGFQEVASRVVKTQHGAAIFVDHTYQYDQQTRARNQQVAFPTADKFYYLTCGGPASVFDDYKYGFELFFKTFRVKS